MHHIVCDNWSIGIFFRELSSLYDAFLQGKPSPLPLPYLQYADFAAWQREQSDLFGDQLDYWQRQLADLPVLQLPCDQPRPSVQTFRGGRSDFQIPSRVAEDLSALARQEDATPFMVLVSVLAVLLHWHTGQDDVPIGTIVAGRTRVELEDVLGCFVNSLVLRLDLSGNPSFRKLLKRTREVTLGALSNQEVPFETIVERLQPVRDPNRSPLFQVLFNLNAAIHPLRLTGIYVEPLSVSTETSIADLALSVIEGQSGLRGFLEFRSDLFERQTGIRLAHCYSRLLERISSNADLRLSELETIDPGDIQRICIDWNASAASYPEIPLVHELVERHAVDHPADLAVQSDDLILSYGDLNRRANQLAHYLRALGAAPGVIVGVCLERSAEMLISMLAVMKAGAAYMPIDPAEPGERLRLMLEEAPASVLLSKRSLVHSASNPILLLYLDDPAVQGAVAAEGNDAPVTAVGPLDLAYVVFTSGSTGKAKGVAVEHRALLNLVHWTIRSFRLSPADRMAWICAPAFDGSVWTVWPIIAAGASLHIPVEQVIWSSSMLQTWIETKSITVANMVSRLAEGLGALDWSSNSSFRLLLTGGDVLRKYPGSSFPAEVFNNYGPTECAVIATSGPVHPDQSQVPPNIGRPIANVQIYVMNPYLQPVPIGVVGELYVGGVGVARGYVNDSALTAERFLPNPFGRGPGSRIYRTGDLGRYLPSGEIQFVGRVDEQVKIRGFRVELAEVEANLRSHPQIRDAVVVARELGGGLGLVAYVVGRDERAPSTSELRDWLRQQVPSYMVPSAFVSMDSLPLTDRGKVDRAALPIPDGTRPDLDEVLTVPRTPIEEIMVGIFEDVLGLRGIGIHDNFFDLGGHSLMASQIVSRARNVFGDDLSLSAVFETPTVAGLAARIDSTGDWADKTIPRKLSGGEVPLSFAQERLWFIEQLAHERAAYNAPLAFRLHGTLDPGALERAVNEVVRRHELLRTTFTTVDGIPRQVVNADLRVPLERWDLRPLGPTEANLEAVRRVAADAQAPFDLRQGPVIRLLLLRIADDTHILSLNIHHIACDGWSKSVLFREIRVLYEAFLSGQVSPLAELKIQYRDFATWERSRAVSDFHEPDWLKRLASAPRLLDLPYSRSRPAIESFRGGRYRFLIEKTLAEEIKALARSEGATLFMTLLAAFQTLLFRYTGQDKMAIGTAIANRTRLELEELIGFFVNTLVVHADLAGNPTFRHVIARARTAALEAFSHQEVPFERLVADLQPARDLSHNPLFQVMFVLQNAPDASLALKDLVVTDLPVDTMTAKFDLALDIHEVPEGLRAVLEYSTDLFDPETIERLAGHFLTLVRSVVADPDLRILTIPLLTDDERKLLSGWNETAAAYPAGSCIHQLVDEQAARDQQALAVVDGDEQLSYGELSLRANRLAHFLRRWGVGPEVRVGMFLERSAEAIVTILGILKAGGVYVPVDPGYPVERTALILDDADLTVMVSASRLATRLPAHRIPTICLDLYAASIEGESGETPRNLIRPDNLAYIMYTSGSTGVPKGVMVPHRGIVSLVATAAICPLSESDIVLHRYSLSFDPSVWEIFAALSCGAQLVISPSSDDYDPSALALRASNRTVTLLSVVPSVLELLVEANRMEELISVKTVVCGGDILPPQLQRRFFQQSSAQLINVYGPTEASIDVSRWVCNPSNQDSIVPIGHPMANLQLHILDDAFQQVPIGVPGELYIGGLGLSRGYFGRPDLTAERFVPDPFTDGPGGRLYRTGDVARYRPDGAIVFLGRNDRQVKIHGYRIELGEIEEVLRKHPAVRDAVTVGWRRNADELRLVTYVVPDTFGLGDSGHSQASLLSEWRSVFDHVPIAAPVNPAFNIAGWTSSYTGKPIPADHMLEWVENTVSQIQELRPNRVLEIGTGTGLVLLRVAPDCAEYVATDFSAEQLNWVKAELAKAPARLSSVTLQEREATNFIGIPKQHFDVVVINSVSQYFPSVEYFLEVITQAEQAVRPGGFIFIGDVRSLPLHGPFVSSLELGRIEETTTKSALRARVRELMRQERELLLHPAAFAAFRRDSPGVRHVEIRPKRGLNDNEMTRFRYDVLLFIGGDVGELAHCEWHDWIQEQLTIARVANLLSTRREAPLGIKRVPNARVANDAALWHWITNDQGPDAVRDWLDSVPTPYPSMNDLMELASGLGLRADFSWAAGYDDGSFDVAFRPEAKLRRDKTFVAFPAGGADLPIESCANRPLQEQQMGSLVPELRAYAKSKLPGYMVPSNFVLIDALPLNPTGKVDVTALPPPETSRSEVESVHEGPRDPIEAALTEIWTKVLGTKALGVHDNFFDLGGDSILSIRMVALANSHGLTLTPRQVFQYQTIAELARTTSRATSIPVRENSLVGDVPLTPMQCRFFHQPIDDPNKFTTSILVDVRHGLDPGLLKAAFADLLSHHEAFRLRFEQREIGWRQWSAPHADGPWFGYQDCSSFSDGEQSEAIASTTVELQEAINIQRGPTVSMTLLECGPSGPSHLICTAHHLCMDGVSWRIFLEDLQMLYDFHSDGAAGPIPLVRTTSFSEWAGRLSELANSSDLAAELDHWRKQLPVNEMSLSPDYPSGTNDWALADRVRVVLSADNLPLLLREVPARLHIRPEELLLSALLIAYQSQTGQSELFLQMEGHGREELFSDVDLSRTVGWFTCEFPVILKASPGGDVIENIGLIRKTLGAVPKRGIGYGILRYLCPGANSLASLPQPQVRFNYLGQFDQTFAGSSIFRASGKSLPVPTDVSGTRAMVLEVDAIVVRGELAVNFTYSTGLHSRSTIETLAKQFMSVLEAFLADRAQPERTGAWATPVR